MYRKDNGHPAAEQDNMVIPNNILEAANPMYENLQLQEVNNDYINLREHHMHVYDNPNREESCTYSYIQ